ncbi:hypothetical protein QJS10_CPA02g00613 [Acorus calamus]|uniref:PGG domain-containing protein n=1 Tax=Acorus calamus TaxID=4465 RepID=A0AAV9FBB5_ACOCL|nr:hypothetical protein QJS10_CPA02g00613 [Acorus calamus]
MEQGLYKAARLGDLQYVLQPDNVRWLQSSTPHGNTALHIAARLGHIDFAKALLTRCESCDILLTRTNDDGENPLHVAAKAGDANVAEAMMTHRKPVDPETGVEGVAVITKAKNQEGNTPLHEAVRAGHSEVAMKLLQWDRAVADEANLEGKTPLHLATQCGMYNVVNAMLDVVVPPVLTETSTLQRTHTPLHEAVMGGHEEVVALLIQKRKDMILVADATGHTALHYAAQKNNGQMVNMLLRYNSSLAYIQNSKGSPPLHIAAAYNSKLAITELLKWCPDSAEQLDESKMTALHVAIMHGSVRALRTLLKMIDLDEIVNWGDKDLNTPLHVAAKNSKIQSMIELLEDKRIDVHLINKNGETACDIIESQTEIDSDLLYMWNALKKREARPIWKGISFRKKLGKSVMAERFKSSAETYTLVAALIATVTFAAIFTRGGAM